MHVVAVLVAREHDVVARELGDARVRGPPPAPALVRRHVPQLPHRVEQALAVRREQLADLAPHVAADARAVRLRDELEPVVVGRVVGGAAPVHAHDERVEVQLREVVAHDLPVRAHVAEHPLVAQLARVVQVGVGVHRDERRLLVRLDERVEARHPRVVRSRLAVPLDVRRRVVPRELRGRLAHRRALHAAAAVVVVVVARGRERGRRAGDAAAAPRGRERDRAEHQRHRAPERAGPRAGRGPRRGVVRHRAVPPLGALHLSRASYALRLERIEATAGPRRKIISLRGCVLCFRVCHP